MLYQTEFSYRLEDCANIQEDIITNFDLSEVVDQVITLRDNNNKPLDGCWQVFQIAYQPVEEDIVLGVYKCYEDCGDCLPPDPTPYPLKPRIVDPNYTTGNCDPDIVESVFCKYAENEYKKVLNKRFGIKDCCPEDEDKIYINNEKIKLLLIQSKTPPPPPPPTLVSYNCVEIITCVLYQCLIQASEGGTLFYKNCEGIEVEVDFFASKSNILVNICSIPNATSSDIYAIGSVVLSITGLGTCESTFNCVEIQGTEGQYLTLTECQANCG
jgi:hypothetical protein